MNTTQSSSSSFRTATDDAVQLTAQAHYESQRELDEMFDLHSDLAEIEEAYRCNSLDSTQYEEAKALKEPRYNFLVDKYNPDVQSDCTQAPSLPERKWTIEDVMPEGPEFYLASW